MGKNWQMGGSAAVVTFCKSCCISQMRSCLLCLFVKAAVHRLFLRDTYFQMKTSDTSHVCGRRLQSSLDRFLVDYHNPDLKVV